MATYQPTAPFIYASIPDNLIVPVTFDVSVCGDLSAGTVIAQLSASGLYAEYDDTQTDGRETAVGILLQDIDSSKGDQPYLIAFGGTFYKANLTGLDANAITDLGGKTVKVSDNSDEDLFVF